MKKTKIVLLSMLVLMIATGTLFAGGGSDSGSAATPYNLPRNETLYFNGLQWGAPSGYQPYVGNTSTFSGGHRQVVYETLFVYNLLDGQAYPQIADSFSESGRTFTVNLNRNVRFQDGTPLTAADVVYSIELAKNYVIGASGNWDYIDSVRAQGDFTVIIEGKANNFNRLQILGLLTEFSITSRAYWESKIASGELSREPTALVSFPGWDCPGTGPYVHMSHNESRIVLARNEQYWGRHNSRYGKLPTPRYLVSVVFSSNAAGDEAFRRGDIDVSQQFIAQVQNFFSSNVATWLPVAPYHVPGVIPSVIFNTQRPGLDDPAVRRAIAMVVDYDLIGVNAMAGQTAPKQHHIMLPSAAEQALIDPAALTQYQWQGRDIAGANRILDEAGWVRGADGVRAKGGVRLAFQLMCPYGWSDWNASLEVIAQSTTEIGIALTTNFPEQPIWNAARFNGTFDIVMDSPGGQGMASPWSRANSMMGSSYLPPVGTPNPIGNWGRYVNPEANRLISEIMNETDPARLRQHWTALNIIYLQEMPVIGLMYRPWLFHAVNTTHWTGFPTAANNPRNIPPQICIDGYGIRALYEISARRR